MVSTITLPQRQPLAPRTPAINWEDVMKTDDIAAVAIAGFALSTATISVLKTRGVLTTDDVSDLHEAVLSSLEHLDIGIDSNIIDRARVIIEANAQITTTGTPSRKKPRPNEA